jgi:small redox-active disulfide protein 2
MKVEILGTGCTKCDKLEEMVKIAVQESGINADIIHIKDMKKIVAYGVLATPALVIDGQVKTSGKIPPLEEIKKMIYGL